MKGSYRRLDTYYDKKDRLKAPFYLYRSDILYSINGALHGSKMFDLALKWNKKIVMHWAGSDVLRARESFKKGSFQKEFIEKAAHWCQSEWIQKELNEIGINAEIIGIHGQKTLSEAKPFPKEMKVLSYLPENRAGFYGEQAILTCAQAFPEINFHLIGTGKKYQEKNILSHGWVNNPEDFINDSVVVIRFAEHDSLADIVLKSLHRGRYVLYNYPFNYCEHCTTHDDLIKSIGSFKSKFDKGLLELNIQAHNFVESSFNENVIFNQLHKRLQLV